MSARLNAPKICVVGLGSTLRRDDAVGLRAAQYLKHAAGAAVTVVEEERDGAALMQLWKSADVVILLDAMASGNDPGTVWRFDAHARCLPQGWRTSSHAFGLAEAVEMARTLGDLPGKLIIYGVEGGDFSPGVGLTPAVEKAAGELVSRVMAELREMGF